MRTSSVEMEKVREVGNVWDNGKYRSGIMEEIKTKMGRGNEIFH